MPLFFAPYYLRSLNPQGEKRNNQFFEEVKSVCKIHLIKIFKVFENLLNISLRVHNVIFLIVRIKFIAI